ncbi:low molecular weight protein-tyrosine-phosphatase [Kocuria massiliensis]|uniref:low molecular weight protein-tyrosine-phosphatase n=1 Tax=Kocuria massiliensis TaxID=1926282 RepID=UPI0022B955CB|nr:low molecular weight protein-tyrosine-phosphatase [Kocuria massiliensis]
MYRIVTVCTGNICRSPMAEYLLRRAADQAGLPGVVVDSAGVSDEERGNPIDPRARDVLSRLGIDTSDHAARQVTRKDLADSDLVLALDVPHYRALRRMASDESQEQKIRLLREFDPQVGDRALEDLGIYDPWYGDASDFEATFTMIDDAVNGVVEEAARHAEARADGGEVDPR